MRSLMALIDLIVANESANARNDDKKQENVPEGAYVVVGGEKGGVKFPEEVFKKTSEMDRTIVFKGDKMIKMDNPKKSQLQ